MKLHHITLPLALLFAISACSDQDHEHQTPDEVPALDEHVTFDVPESFKTALEASLDHYFELSSALVEADTEAAKAHSQAFLESAQGIDPEELDQEVINFLQEHADNVFFRAMNIMNEDDIGKQRYEFEYLSEAVIEVVRAVGPLSYTVYQQRCPMVRDGSADWLSRDSGILNPYHGDRMLRCGSVVREI